MYSALTYDVTKSYLTRAERKTRKFVMAILHWKQGLLCDKIENGLMVQRHVVFVAIVEDNTSYEYNTCIIGLHYMYF